MEPMIPAGHRVIVDMDAYDERGPSRGDIVSFIKARAKPGPMCEETRQGRQFIMRVIGLPGETLEIRRGVT